MQKGGSALNQFQGTSFALATQSAMMAVSVLIVGAVIPASTQIYSTEFYFLTQNVGSIDWVLWLTKSVIFSSITIWVVCLLIELVGDKIFEFRGTSFVVPGTITALLILKALENQIQSSIGFIVLFSISIPMMSIFFYRARAFFPAFLATSTILLFSTTAYFHLNSIEDNSRSSTISVNANNSGGPVFLIVLDEVSFNAAHGRDRQVLEIYPNLKKLSSESTNYLNAFSTAGFTHISIPAIFSGEYPESPTSKSTQFDSVLGEFPIHRLIPSDTSIVQVEFGEKGTGIVSTFESDNGVIILNFVLPGQALRVLDVPELLGKWSNFRNINDDVGAVGQELDISYLRDIDSSALLMYHTDVNHHPWAFDSDGKLTHEKKIPTNQGSYLLGMEVLTSGELPFGYGTKEKTLLAQRMYTHNLEWTDKQVGHLFTKIREAGVWDKSTIILTSDHGNAFDPFQDGRQPEEIEKLWSQLAHVPLMVKFAGQKDKINIDTPTTIIRIASTLLDALGLETSKKNIAPSLCSSNNCKQDLEALSKPRFFRGNSIQALDEMYFNELYQNSDFYLDRAHVSDAINTKYPFAVGELEPYVGAKQSSLKKFRKSDFKSIPLLNDLDSGSEQLAYYLHDLGNSCQSVSQGLLVIDGLVMGTVQFDATEGPNRGGWTILPSKNLARATLYCEAN